MVVRPVSCPTLVLHVGVYAYCTVTLIPILRYSDSGKAAMYATWLLPTYNICPAATWPALFPADMQQPAF